MTCVFPWNWWGYSSGLISVHAHDITVWCTEVLFVWCADDSMTGSVTPVTVISKSIVSHGRKEQTGEGMTWSRLVLAIHYHVLVSHGKVEWC